MPPVVRLTLALLILAVGCSPAPSAPAAPTFSAPAAEIATRAPAAPTSVATSPAEAISPVAPAPRPTPSPSPSPAPVAVKPGTKPSFDETAVASFYRGKRLTILVGFSPGGGYDAYARLLSRHMGRYIPGNPSVVVQNMPGTGSLLAANTLFTSSPKDGTVIGTFARGLPFEELLARDGVQFSSSAFHWIGSINEEVSLCVVRRDASVDQLEDLYTTPVRVGGTGSGADSDFFPRFLNGLLGTRFSVLRGYPGGNEVNQAIERGEVQGRCGFSWSSLTATRPRWLEHPPLVNLLVQLSLRKHPDLPQVPLVLDFARDADERQLLRVVLARQTMGRPFAAPPGVPAERVAALRHAFDHTMLDKQFLDEADQSGMELNPASGREVQEVVAEIFRTSPDQLRRLSELTRSE